MQFLRYNLQEELVCYEEAFQGYNANLHHPGEGCDFDTFSMDYTTMSLNIRDTYNDLEAQDGTNYDNNPWYPYIEYVTCRIVKFFIELPDPITRAYGHLVGVQSMISSIPLPTGEPIPALVPIISMISTYSAEIDKFIKLFDSMYSYETCAAKQRAYNTSYITWTGRKREINKRLDFYNEVANRMRPIFRYIPQVLKKSKF